MLRQPCSGGGRAGEGHQVAVVQMVQQVAGRAGDELQRALRQQTGCDHQTDAGPGDVAGRGGRLDDGRHAGQEGRRELLQHAPDREVEGIDLHRHAGAAGVDVLTLEAVVLGEDLDRTVDDDVAVRQFTASLRGVGEQRPDATVDVGEVVLRGRPGGVRQVVQLVLVGGQVLGELLEQQSTFVDGQCAEGALPDRTGEVHRGRGVEAFGADQGHRRTGAGIGHDGRVLRVGRGPPRALDVAGHHGPRRVRIGCRGPRACGLGCRRPGRSGLGRHGLGHRR
ncbi:hypothetical protein SDC9_67822 [bioreactor metagenome]|uniref:Uncharacterized protein n=1 Tax=bioreactor metagenome TaxID=1076179 RepID=A0A644Y005_9ZZZZ